MSRTLLAAAGLAVGTLGLSVQTAFAVDFVGGNLVVSKVGTGSAALSNAATPVSLLEFTTAGLPVSSPLDLNSIGAANKLTLSGTATSEGALTRSSNGQYLTIGGYNSVAGSAGVVASAAARNVARVALDRSVDLTTSLTDAHLANNIRSVVSTDGNTIWTGGTGTPGTSGGVRSMTLGASTTTQVSASVTNVRNVNIFSGQLYTSAASGAFVGINTVGSGLPTGSGETIVNLIATGGSPYDFVFANATTVYVADDGSLASGGGLKKYTFSGSSWTLAYTLSTNLTAGLRGLTSVTDALGVTTLYAVTADAITAATGNKLVAVTDTGAASPFTTLATAAGNTAFRGVDFAPVPAPGPLALMAFAGLVASSRKRRR